ncbi:DNA-binding protein [Enterobacter hormaechei]|nr:DNA-binding protein [Enterobacter hormaechei]
MTAEPSRIDYIIEKHTITEQSETPRIASQWQKVLAGCQQQRLGSAERLRLALCPVDYVTSFELPFRLLLIRAPQLIDAIRQELTVHSKPVTINEGKRGTVYSLTSDFAGVPDTFHYQRSGKIRRLAGGEITTDRYISIARQTTEPRNRLRLAFTSGLPVTALDALLFFGVQRVAADVSVLRREGLNIGLRHVDTFDSATQAVRAMPLYCVAR